MASETALRMRGRRLPRCSGCGLPCTVCLCADLVVIENATSVAVLMHPIEVQKTSNTGQLAVRVLERATLHVCGHRNVPAATRKLLLFPHENARPLTRDDAGEGTLVVVPDGSWRQARRIARRTNDAELVRLVDVPPTRYPLRRGTRSDTLSTFEAIVEALSLLEGPHIRTRAMPIFDRFVARILSLRSSARPNAVEDGARSGG